MTRREYTHILHDMDIMEKQMEIMLSQMISLRRSIDMAAENSGVARQAVLDIAATEATPDA